MNHSSWARFQTALQFLRRYFAPTRLPCASSLGRGTDTQVYLKLESELPTGSFKLRGALYALNAEMGRRTVPEVVASSTGNHGAAVAYAGKILNVPVTIFLPRNSNPTKQRRIREQGAKIIEHGKDISEAFDAANAYANRTGAFLLSDASNPDVPIGTGTIAIEIVEQLPDVDEIWVPIGDTALIRGVAAAAKHLRPGVRVIGVQAERAPSYYLSWKRGVVVTTKSCDTIADGLATRIPIQENVTAIRGLVDDVNLVTEAQLLSAVEHLYISEQIVAEPAGAATTAAWLATSRQTPNAPVVLLVTGSNIAEPAKWSARKIFQNSETIFRGSPNLKKLEEVKMQALLVVDVQNEFSGKGLRTVPNYEKALRRIARHVEEAREAGWPIAWVQHFNKPHESKAFVPKTWGSQLSPGMGPQSQSASERLFTKDVYGAFSAEGLEDWLNELGVRSVLIVGFYAHMCLSTSVREALIRGLDVFIDPEATGARDLEHPVLGSQSAEEVRRSALLQLTNMGAQVLAQRAKGEKEKRELHVCHA